MDELGRTPLTDSRIHKLGSGDTYCYYPGNRFNNATMAGISCVAIVNDLEAFLNGEEVEVPEAPTIQ